MKTRLNFNELIEQYRNGLLNQEERKFVDKLQETDPEFQKEFQLHVHLDSAILDMDLMNFEKQIATIHKDYEKKHSIPILWRVAASVAFIIVVGSLFYLTNPGLLRSSQSLADNYYEVYKPLSAFRSGDQPSDLLLAEAFDLFTRKDFSNAANKFKNLLNLNPSNNMARFYLGISLIETGKPSDAIPLMQEIIQQKDVLFGNQAEWYLSLCFLKTNDKAEAKKHLKILVSKNSHYKAQALNLLKELK